MDQNTSRTVTLRFRVTPEEAKTLKTRCDRAALSLSDFIRSRVLEAPTTPVATKPPAEKAVATNTLCPRCTRIGQAACYDCQTGFKNGENSTGGM